MTQSGRRKARNLARAGAAKATYDLLLLALFHSVVPEDEDLPVP